MQRYQLFIDGQWRDPSTGRWFETANPYTGEAWAQIPRADATDVDLAVAAAHRAFREGAWPALSASQRGRLVRRFGEVLEKHAAELATIEARDNGKLYAETFNQARYLCEWFQFYGGLADKIEGSVPAMDKPDVLNYTRHEPLGVCACITPWNSPLLLLAWKAAPALAAGNTLVIKPSEFTSASTLEFARLSLEAGFPPGVVNVVTGFGAEVGEPLVRHPKVRKVAFTGGESGGRSVNVAAAADFKRVTLELGGKSANIVFDDANLDQAVSGAISGIFAASGQTCIAGSRLLLQDSIHDEFLERLLAIAARARLGDPMLPETQVGPITTGRSTGSILDYIAIAKAEGARCVLGGEPAILPGVARPVRAADDLRRRDAAMRIAQEEVFGPVLAVMRFKDLDEAVEIANDVNYGLAAGVWTENLRRAVRMADRLQAGTVWVNTYRSTSYTSPFGGYKASGLGRENGVEAIKEYLQIKSVWIYTGGDVANPFIRR